MPPTLSNDTDAAGTPIDLSIIVPALDEGPTLAILVDQVQSSLERLPDLSYEILIIDDGSRDETWATIVGLSESRAVVRGVRLRRNFGKATALSVGIEASHGSTIVTMDADLQDDPDELPTFLEHLQNGADLVSGWKRDRKDPLGKRLPSKFFNWATNRSTGLTLHDHNCGFKAAHREVYELIPLYGELHRYVPALAHRLGFRVEEIPVNHRPRAQGKSKYGFERYLRGFLDLLTVIVLSRYDKRPGHFFGGLGIALGTIGAVALFYLAGVWLFTDHPIGNRPLLSFGILLEVVAIQLVSLGVLSELVLSQSTQPPPSTFVREQVGTPC